MSLFGKLTIYHRILSMALLIILLLSGALAVVVWDSLDDIVAQLLEKRGAEIAAHVAQGSGNYVLTDDYYNLYELASQTMAGSEDIRYILVFDSNHRLLAHTFQRGVPRELLALEAATVTPPYRVATYASNEGPIHDVVVPIENGAVGFVRLGMTEGYTRNLIMSHIRGIVIAIIAVCGLAAAIASGIARRITRPISELAQVAEAITHGNPAVRAAVADRGEVGKLAAAFNDMASSLINANEDKEGLLEELRAKEQLRATLISKLITAQEDERKRISRELHDETSQALTSLMLTMRALAEDATSDAQREALLTGRDVAAEILRDVRQLAIELRPPVLDDLGLVPAINKYIEKFGERQGLSVELSATGADRQIDGRIAVALYRIIQEGLGNVVKHAGARKVRINIADDLENISLTIADDGRGISAADLLKAQRENRLGLYGMRERVELLQGRLDIEAAPEGGTALIITIPHYDREGGKELESENHRSAGR
jgi:signal transduction histidine kinase